MAKEVVQGEVVEVLEDDGPEEGEIEDDTSDEDNVENYGLCSSNSTKVNTTIGAKYYQPPCTSSSEVHSLKSQTHSEEKTEKSWGSTGRRHYQFYVDHDKPSRESYNRLKKSDLNSDHRGINFHDLLIDYKTSKHGNEGNTHEKENRHYAKEVRVEPTRKRESVVNDAQVDKIKRSKKRKHRRSPSRSPVSSETDVGRRRKDLRASRPKRKKKLAKIKRNINESAALFAQIRASKLNLAASELKKSTIEVINVVSEGENTTEVSEKCLTNSEPVISDGEGSLIGKNIESRASGKEGEELQKETNYDCSKCLSTASDTQTAERVEDSESKDEDDDVNQLRMIALQSAFRAKYLARKRRGLIIRKQAKKSGSNISTIRSNADSILDDTAELLEAAVEEAVLTSPNKDSSPLADPIQSVLLCNSLSEVPLPPDEPRSLPSMGQSLVEDLTPVDMELALTDEEENADQVKGDDSDAQFESLNNMVPKVRISRCIPKTRNIPVTIGRNQHFKLRQRPSNNDPENSRRTNLLEVRTSENEGHFMENLDSSCISMEDVKMGSMIVLDAVGTCSSPEVCQVLEEDQTLSEASDSKSDLIPAYSAQCFMSGIDNDDEDEELLRARLLLEISSRHKKEESITVSSLAMEDNNATETHMVKISTHNLVRTVHTEATKANSQIKLNGKGSSPAATFSQQKLKTATKRNMERMRKVQQLVKAHSQGASLLNQFPISTFIKGRTSKISNRGKYQRINQNRLALVKKRPDGNLQVTVPCSSKNTKVVSQIPQQQDRIVICLGEDSDESEDEKQKSIIGGVLADKTTTLLEQSKPTDSASCGAVSIDFEKSVDLFLKEVRSVQESKSKTVCPVSSAIVGKEKTGSVLPVAARPKVAANTPKTHPAKAESMAVTGVTPQAVRHLPFPQQEEYRRLKMKISILEEMHKKRKAGEVTQALPKSDQKIALVGSGPVLKLADQTALMGASIEKKSDVNESSNLPNSVSFLSSNSLTKQAVLEVKNGESNLLSKIGNDDDDNEDENLMREQLLRSRLRKRAAAMADASSLKTENFPAKAESIPSKTESITSEPECSSSEPNSKMEISSSKGSISPLCKGGILSNEQATLPQKEVIPFNGEVPPTNTEVSLKKNMPLIMEEDTSSKENNSLPVMEVTSSTTDASKENKSQPSVEEISSMVKAITSKVEAITIETTNASSMAEPSSGNDFLELKEVAGTIEDSKTHEAAHSEIKMDESKDEAGKVCPAVLPASSGPGEVAACVNPKSKMTTNQENSESRASQLMELEFQLLSERHAALKYLSELSNLLNKMETEGNRLKEKEASVKKLKAELSLAEAALHTQKSFMKQLALNVSSTHARVTATRQKCTMLSRACLKLGNQIKQDEIANGGEKTIYKVPTGGAELVKSQLSSVLCHTKQLKKSGLPFLGLSQEFIIKDSYLAKKPGKRFMITQVQPRATQWAKLPTPMERLSLMIDKKDPTFVPPKFVKPVKTSTSLVKIPVEHNATSNAEPPEIVGASPSTVGRTLPVAKSAVTLMELGVSPKSTLVPKTSSITPIQASKNELHIPCSSDKPDKVVSTTMVTNAVTSKSKESAASGVKPVTIASSFTLVPSDPSRKRVLESGTGNAIQLRDYHSPLEPISRTCPKNLKVATSSGSSRVECEDSVMLDPNVMLCPYDLMGVCQDEECIYQHQRRKGVVKES